MYDKQFWDNVYTNNITPWVRDDVTMHMINAVKNYITPSGALMLDYGCGSGGVAAYFRAQGAVVDLAEISDEMLPYSKKAFESYLEGYESGEITSSSVWYEERKDFSQAAIGTERVAHREERGFELLQGREVFEGALLGGCLDSFYDLLTGSRYGEEKEICEKYGIFPEKEQWTGKILFIETSEEQPDPKLYEKALLLLKERGIFDVITGILVGKPQDEVYYEEYKEVLKKVVDDENLPIVYNVNFGHATPRCVLQYGATVKVDMNRRVIEKIN